MQQSKAEIYLHFVWKTWRRELWVTETIERRVHRCIQSKAVSLGCQVLGVNGMPDHVHVVVKMASTVCAAVIAHRTKGPSSTLARALRDPEPFGWQDGYAAISISPADVAAVVAYVRNQKQHHAAGSTIPVWEPPAYEDDGTDRKPT